MSEATPTTATEPGPTRFLIAALVTIGSMVALILASIVLFGEEA